MTKALAIRSMVLYCIALGLVLPALNVLAGGLSVPVKSYEDID